MRNTGYLRHGGYAWNHELCTAEHGDFYIENSRSLRRDGSSLLLCLLLLLLIEFAHFFQRLESFKKIGA